MRKKRPLTISVHEAAEALGVVPATVYAWVRAGEIPSLRLGGRIRIPTGKLADLLGVEPEELVSTNTGPDRTGGE
jgi:excisionase family DNA binding protein